MWKGSPRTVAKKKAAAEAAGEEWHKAAARELEEEQAAATASVAAKQPPGGRRRARGPRRRKSRKRSSDQQQQQQHGHRHGRLGLAFLPPWCAYYALVVGVLVVAILGAWSTKWSPGCGWSQGLAGGGASNDGILPARSEPKPTAEPATPPTTAGGQAAEAEAEAEAEIRAETEALGLQLLSAVANDVGEHALRNMLTSFSASSATSTSSTTTSSSSSSSSSSRSMSMSIVNVRAAGGLTPLHLAVVIAARSGAGAGAGEASLGATRALLDHGAGVNHVDDTHATPLHYAAGQGRGSNGPELVRLLLAHGASTTAKDLSNLTPLCVARAAGHREVEDVLRASRCDVETTIRALVGPDLGPATGPATAAKPAPTGCAELEAVRACSDLTGATRHERFFNNTDEPPAAAPRRAASASAPAPTPAPTPTPTISFLVHLSPDVPKIVLDRHQLELVGCVYNQISVIDVGSVY